MAKVAIGIVLCVVGLIGTVIGSAMYVNARQHWKNNELFMKDSLKSIDQLAANGAGLVELDNARKRFEIDARAARSARKDMSNAFLLIIPGLMFAGSGIFLLFKCFASQRGSTSEALASVPASS